jgi:hypothetical protein
LADDATEVQRMVFQQRARRAKAVIIHLMTRNGTPSNKGLNQLVASLPLVSPSVDMTFVVKSI